jgi:Fibronectin type III domain
MGYDINSVALIPTLTRQVINQNGGAPTVTFPSSFTSFLMSGWFWLDGLVTMGLAAETITGGPTRQWGFQVTVNFPTGSAPQLQTGDGTTTGFGNIITFSQPAIDQDTWVNILCSCDVATNTAQLYVNDVACTISSATWAQTTVKAPGGVSAVNVGAFSALLSNGCMGDFYLGSTASFYDLSIVANRRKFIDQFGFMVDLGSNASAPTGTSPQVYLSIRDAGMPTEILTNRGTGGGSPFVMNDLSTPVTGTGCVELPLPPSPFCGAVHTNTSFTAAWTPNPFGGTPDAYDVQYRVSGTVDWTFLNNIMAESVLITGLLQNTVYEFQVAALRDNNPSDFSASCFCGTGTVQIEMPVPQTLHRWRGQVGLNWKGMALVGDAFSNVVGLSDFDNFTEYGNTMRFLITTPPIHEDRKRIFIPRFEIEVEAGNGLPNDPSVPPQMMLEWSKDGGVTWSLLSLPRSMGSIGQYIKRLRWLNLGQSRTWVFRLTCTDPVRRYVIGTYIDDYRSLG